MSAIPANSVPGQFESTPNENEQHKLETGNDRSERMRRRFAAVSQIRFITRECVSKILLPTRDEDGYPVSGQDVVP